MNVALGGARVSRRLIGNLLSSKLFLRAAESNQGCFALDSAVADHRAVQPPT
jgi:hypothetical protein